MRMSHPRVAYLPSGEPVGPPLEPPHHGPEPAGPGVDVRLYVGRSRTRWNSYGRCHLTDVSELGKYRCWNYADVHACRAALLLGGGAGTDVSSYNAAEDLTMHARASYRRDLLFRQHICCCRAHLFLKSLISHGWGSGGWDDWTSRSCVDVECCWRYGGSTD